MTAAQQMYSPGRVIREMIKLDGSWNGSYPTDDELRHSTKAGKRTEEDRNGRSELLCGHVEVVHDTEQFTGRKVCSQDAAAAPQAGDRDLLCRSM